MKQPMSKDNATAPRRAPRRRVLKSGVIAFNGRHSTLPCGVRDLSDEGARLTVDGSVAAPDTFELLVDLDGLEAQCEVVWRRAKEVGVRFLAPPQYGAKRRTQVVEQSTKPATRVTLRRKPPAGGR